MFLKIVTLAEGVSAGLFLAVNDEFDIWPVYSGERFRAFRPSCFALVC